MVVNSAAIGAEQMEEVLFGRESAERGVEPGLLERANTGILFFDEVADMPPGTQSKILRVLVDQSFQRVGGGDTVRVDVRVISATTRDLAREVAAGRFRTELFHRLNVVPIAVPGLDARRDDVPELARHFLEELSATQGLAPRTLTPEAEAQLQTLRWPGNVRQLRNTLERTLILGIEPGSDRAGGAGRRDAGVGRRRRARCSAPPSRAWRCARRARCSSGNTWWPRSTASAATSRGRPRSWAWSGRRCIAS